VVLLFSNSLRAFLILSLILRLFLLKDIIENMNGTQPNNPLHGITLEKIITRLVDHYGWSEMGRQINIRCFTHDPSLKSSLKFLRRTPWARAKVEALYLSLDQKD